MKKRIILIVLDSFGIGAAPDAGLYGDEGADTLLHIAQALPVFSLPGMQKLGLYHLYNAAQLPWEGEPQGACFRLIPQAPGKDTTTGHWEMAGHILETPLPVFGERIPEEILRAFSEKIGCPVLGGDNASGTEIIERLGKEHLQTKSPIVYTSADSVFQIAAHTSVCSVEELYTLCETARELLKDDWAVGRVIARPFAGEPGNFVRLPDRRDYSLAPAGETMLDLISRKMDVLTVGKIEDIFVHRGITRSDHVSGNGPCMDAALDFMRQEWEGLLFVNLVDFDSKYGHRRDPAGYGKALREFDDRLVEFQSLLGSDDLLIITADHGCDPTHRGTDHTRETVPLLIWGNGVKPGAHQEGLYSLSTVAKTVCGYLGVSNEFVGIDLSGRLFKD